MLDAACVAWALHAGAGEGGADASAAPVLLALGGHAVASAIAAGGLLLAAPPAAAGARGSFFAFAMALAFFVPVAGPIGLELVVRYGLGAKAREAADPWTTLDVDEELAERPVSVKRRGVSGSKIASILARRAPEEAERRFQAILQVKHLPPREQIQVLKLALKDASDEVRLFAFSRIEKFRSDLEGRIKQFSTDLETAPREDRALLHLRLAESFHEIAYLSLAEGAVLTHALQEAQKNALAAKELRPDSGPADYLLGRIFLRLGEYDRSIQSFQSAVRQRHPRAKIIPYMAECAFRQRRFDVLSSMLGEMARVSGDAHVLESVAEQWR